MTLEFAVKLADKSGNGGMFGDFVGARLEFKKRSGVKILFDLRSSDEQFAANKRSSRKVFTNLLKLSILLTFSIVFLLDLRLIGCFLFTVEVFS